MGKNPVSAKELELEPDAWERFERAVDLMAKSPPQHRTSKPKQPANIKTRETKKAKPSR